MTGSNVTNVQLQALVLNLTARAPKATFMVAGKSYSASALVALVKSILTVRQTAVTSKAAWLDARKQVAQVNSELVPIVGAVRGMLVSMLSNDTGALADLAVAPRRKAPAPTPEERLTTAAKLRATRQARGTTSKKQKAKLKGNVTGITVTTITAPVAVPVNAPSVSASAALVANDVAPAATPSASPTVTPTTPASTAGAVGAPAITGH